ncbi:MAG: DNA-binding protein [Gemmatimonadota bacterium]|nr:DNA-binding protein [Gemmatimonadota bacterium]MDE3171826.1 DNA-binding protein [Gemmatimonadota bacterium]MDE3216185.1 DNA-binding protein [Gemmatimonadota bacterium]
MHSIRFTALAAAVLAFGVAQTALAQGRRGGGGARYDRATVQTVSGTIAAIDTLPSPRGVGGGLHVELRTADRTLSVHLGPRAFLEGRGLTLAVGDALQATGSLVTWQGQPALLAASVTKGTVAVQMRDSTGVPLWALGRRGGGSR